MKLTLYSKSIPVCTVLYEVIQKLCVINKPRCNILFTDNLLLQWAVKHCDWIIESVNEWIIQTVLVNQINECKMSELERIWLRRKIRHYYFLMNFHEHANVYLWIKTHTNYCVSSLTFRILGGSTFLCFFKIFLWCFFVIVEIDIPSPHLHGKELPGNS